MKQYGQFSKPWQELNFSDNYIFCKVMQNPELCKKLLEILLDFRIDKIEYLNTEQTLENNYNTRGIRMDVYVKDSNKVYDLEMQSGDYEDILLRARYYQSACDIANTNRRTQYRNLKETYIIFLCKDDPFGLDLPKYTEHKSFLEDHSFIYNDKTHKLFYNASSFAKEKNQQVREVLEFIYNLKSHPGITQELEKSVLQTKQKPQWEDEYMYFIDIVEEEKEYARQIGHAEGLAAGHAEGHAEGLAEGLAEGHAEGLAEGAHYSSVNTAKKLLAMNTLTKQQIADAVNLPIEEILAL